jgi:hypothetical protein
VALAWVALGLAVGRLLDHLGVPGRWLLDALSLTAAATLMLYIARALTRAVRDRCHAG